MTERNYAAEVLADLRAGSAPNMATAIRAATEIDYLTAINAELVAAARLALRAMTEPPPIGRSYAEVVGALQTVIAKARAS